jgi:hypothetical protein
VTCDLHDQVEEVDETNNTAVVATRIVTAWDFQAAGLWFSNPMPPEGDPIVLTGAVRNAGEAAAESLEVAFWDGVPGTGVIVGTVWATEVGGPDSVTVSVDWPTTGQAGTHEMWMVIDPRDVWEESREDNNDTTATVVVDTFPDLLVVAGTVTIQPDTVVLGEAVEVTGVVRNSSLTGAPSFAVQWWAGASQDSIVSPLAPETTIAALAGTSQETLSLVWEPQDQGDAWVVLVVDSADSVRETNETNNRGASRFTVLPLPDLSITRSDIAFSDAQPMEGDTVDVSIWTHNLSPTPCGPFGLAVWDGDPSGQAAALIHSESGLFLGGLGTAENRFTWPLGHVAGERDVWAVVDPGGEVEESREDNNTASREIWVVQDTVPPSVWFEASVPAFREGDFLTQHDTISAYVTDVQTGPDTSSVTLRLDGTALPRHAWDLTVAAACSLRLDYPVGTGNGRRVLEVGAADLAENEASALIHFRLADGLALGAVCCYPNPFCRETAVLVPVSRSAEVRVSIMTLGGALIRVLQDQIEAPFGRLEWDGRDEDGDQVAAGVYLYVVKADGGDQRVTHLGKVVRMPQ